jgi:hypothetical protein
VLTERLVVSRTRRRTMEMSTSRHGGFLSTMAEVPRSEIVDSFISFGGQQKKVGYILILIKTEEELTRK